MDKVVVVNEKDEVIGEATREDAHAQGIPHRIAVTYVENPEGKILIQVRIGGRYDHSSAGHVDPGESYLETATRELEEEIGIVGAELSPVTKGVSEVEPPRYQQHRVHHMQIFSCVAEPGKLQEEEVERVFWADPAEILADMRANPEHNNYTGEFLFSLPLYMEHRTQH